MSFRRFVGETLVRAANGAGLPAVIEALSSTDVTILCYHSIVDGPIPPSLMRRGLHLRVESFREQMGYLAARCEVLPLAEALRQLDRKSRSRRPKVVITFDDGYRNNLELAAPILERAGLPASIFLVSKLLDSPKPFWWDELGLLIDGAVERSISLPTIGTVLLTDKQARADLNGQLRRQLTTALPSEREELLAPLRSAQKGLLATSLVDLLRPLRTSEALGFPSLVRFGNHTATHRVLAGIDEDDIRWELETGRADLGRAFGQRFDPSVICYPRGIVSSSAVKVAEALEIPVGLGLRSNTWLSRARPNSPRRALPRVIVGGRYSFQRFRLGLSGIVVS